MGRCLAVGHHSFLLLVLLDLLQRLKPQLLLSESVILAELFLAELGTTTQLETDLLPLSVSSVSEIAKRVDYHVERSTRNSAA